MIGKAPIVWVFLADMQKWVNYFKESGAVARADEAGHAAWRAPGLGDLHLCMQDAIIAAQNAVIAGEALGLGSCYIGDVIENFEDLSSLLDLKQYTIPAAMLIFGYPKQTQSTKQSPRCPVDAIFMENSYKEPHSVTSSGRSASEEARRSAPSPTQRTWPTTTCTSTSPSWPRWIARRVMFDWWRRLIFLRHEHFGTTMEPWHIRSPRR